MAACDAIEVMAPGAGLQIEFYPLSEAPVDAARLPWSWFDPERLSAAALTDCHCPEQEGVAKQLDTHIGEKA